MADPIVSLKTRMLNLANATKVVQKAVNPTTKELQTMAGAQKQLDKAMASLVKRLTTTQTSTKGLFNALQTTVKGVKDETYARLNLQGQIKQNADGLRKERKERELKAKLQRQQLEKLDLFNYKKNTEALKRQKEAVERLNRAYPILTGNYKRFTMAQKNGTTIAILNTKHLRLQSNSLAVFRSKMLLAAFAINLYQQSIMRLVKAYGDQEAAELKVLGTLMATNGAAKVSFESIKSLTEELQRNGVVGDEVNLQMAGLMLTYDQIGAETFPRAMKAMNDMATSLAMGIPTVDQLKSSTTMLSKALQDPVRNMGALRKVGFSLSAAQEKQIKNFTALNKIGKAQAVILKAAEKQYGGLAKIIQKSTLGQVQQLNMALGDTGELIGRTIAPTILSITNSMRSFLESFDAKGVADWTTRLLIFGTAMVGVRITTSAATAAHRLHTMALDALGKKAALTTVAQKALNVAVRANPYVMVAGTLATIFGPALARTAGFLKDVRSGAIEAANANVKYMESLAGISDDNALAMAEEYNIAIVEQEKLLKNLETGLKNLQDARVDALRMDPWERRADDLDDEKDAIYELIPGLRELTESNKSYKDEVNTIIVTTREHIATLKNVIAGEKDHIVLLEGKAQVSKDLIKTQQATASAKIIQHYNDMAASLQRTKDAQADFTIEGKKIRKWMLKEQLIYSDQLGLMDQFKKSFGMITQAEKVDLKVKDAWAKAARKMNMTYDEFVNSGKAEVGLIKQTITEREKHTNTMAANADALNRLGDLVKQVQQWEAQAAQEAIQRADAQMQNDISRIKETSKYKIAAARNDHRRMKKMEDEARKKSLPDRQAAFKQKKDAARSALYTDWAVSTAKSYAQYGWPAALVPIGVIAAANLMGLAQIEKQTAPSYEYGGLVGGNRHHGGGTMIEAERGEFVMSRNAVGSFGVETLNAMNEGGTAPITVNISGNVLSQDYVEDQLAEQIRNAVRRGVDFG